MLGMSCRIFAAAALLFIIKHQVLPSMGPASTLECKVAGSKGFTLLNRSLDSIALTAMLCNSLLPKTA